MTANPASAPRPASVPPARLSPAQLQTWLTDGGEIALLDVRETGVYAHGHLLLAASAPAWRLGLLIDRLVPRRDTRVVLVDGDGSRVDEAAATLRSLGWTSVSALDGGTQAWVAWGGELFSGTNVPSKAFGELIEHQHHTPSIDADELARRLADGENLVVVDSRTPEEFAQFSLPFAHSLPGGELVYRIGELAPDPATLVVVNCAGRTRSIVGAQTLIDAGIPNPVVSLRDGTMAWLLAGRELARGRRAALPEPGAGSLAQARDRAQAMAGRAGVGWVDDAVLARWQQEADRTLYRFDVRTREEYQTAHLAGWRWAPGGQLVQATDEFIGTRGARIVLADHDGVRALSAAAWLAQLGVGEVWLYRPAADAPRVTGPEPLQVLRPHPAVPCVSPAQAAALLAEGSTLAFDVDRRAPYERRHVAGARFCVPDRLSEFLADAPPQATILIASADGVLAGLVAAELVARTGRDARAIAGGTQAWVAAGLPVGSGDRGVLSGDDDHWFSPYAHRDLARRDAAFRAYLDWELGLVAQLERDRTHAFRLG
jgi:rhodanese-related sulfurtransferase